MSDSRKKSNHKHIYASALIKYPVKVGAKLYTNYAVIKYCTICGKVYNIEMPTAPIIENGKKHYRMLKNSEILEKYKKLPLVEVDNCFPTYIDI